MRLETLILVLILFAAGCGGGGSGGGGFLPAPLTETHPIDGTFDLSGFSGVNVLVIDLYDDLGQGNWVGTTTLHWAIVNDDRHVYLAFEWDDNTYDHDFDFATGPLLFDGIQLFFDNDDDGLLETGEDQRMVIAASVGSQYIDQHVSAGDETDLCGDGFGKLTYDQAAGIYQAEFLLPMTSDSQGQDADITFGPPYNIAIFDHTNITDPLNLSGNVGYAFGDGNSTATWSQMPITASGPHAYPTLPAGLTGLIAFLSSHNHDNREIYTFDPATGIVTQVTNLPALFKDNLSLSHDRRRLAFHGGPASDAYDDFEIYTVEIDGSNLQQLTNNTILDGHPAWSPGDIHIAYASFRDGNQASIVVMTADGIEIDDLTPIGFDDNDPEYLHDGRIVFKTDRFSAAPQVRIAVMDSDGQNVLQLTDLSGVSDHDPVGGGPLVLFERFNKDTHYAADPEAWFTPWDIIGVDVTGGGETLLMDDGWINWLPVYDPTGQYICYLKISGYTAAYLMDSTGKDFGRLIPNMTRIHYIDWK